MKTKLFILLSVIMISSKAQAQISRISFSSGGGSDPNVPTSVGEPFVSSGGNFGIGSRKNDVGSPASVPHVALPTDRIALFPNPTDDEATVVVTGSNQNDFNIKVLNLLGKMVLSERDINTQTTFSLKNEAAGTYLLSVFSKNNQLLFTQQITKK